LSSADVTDPVPAFNVDTTVESRATSERRLVRFALTAAAALAAALAIEATDVNDALTATIAAESTLSAEIRFAVSTLTASFNSADVTLPVPALRAETTVDSRPTSDRRLVRFVLMPLTRSFTDVTAADTVAAAALTVSTLVDIAETLSEIRPTSETRLV
jgi:hypothetical protein